MKGELFVSRSHHKSVRILDENLAETPENRDTSPVSLVPDLDSVLQASSPISFKDRWMAEQRLVQRCEEST